MRFLFALFGYSSVQWAAGRWRRALVWDLLFVGWFALVFHLPTWIAFALVLAQAIDAALLDPDEDRGGAGYAIAGVIALSALGVFALVLRASWVEAFRTSSSASSRSAATPSRCATTRSS